MVALNQLLAPVPLPGPHPWGCLCRRRSPARSSSPPPAQSPKLTFGLASWRISASMLCGEHPVKPTACPVIQTHFWTCFLADFGKHAVWRTPCQAHACLCLLYACARQGPAQAARAAVTSSLCWLPQTRQGHRKKEKGKETSPTHRQSQAGISRRKWLGTGRRLVCWRLVAAKPRRPMPGGRPCRG